MLIPRGSTDLWSAIVPLNLRGKTIATPSGAQYTSENVLLRVFKREQTVIWERRTISPRRIWLYSEIAWIEKDVSWPSGSPFNNAAVPAHSSPSWSWLLCDVALIKHSIKAIPKETQCATLFVLENCAGTVCLWRLTPNDCSPESGSLEVPEHHQVLQKQKNKFI